MKARPDLAEALATSQMLRATARAFRGGEQSPLFFRLNRAANVLDAVAALAMRSLDRIEQLEEELRSREGGP
jgi:hypothetical protein